MASSRTNTVVGKRETVAEGKKQETTQFEKNNSRRASANSHSRRQAIQTCSDIQYHSVSNTDVSIVSGKFSFEHL
jgi:hypothetical protein